MKKVLRSASSLALLLSLVACAPLSLDFLRPQAQGLDTMTQKVGHEAPELAFSFEFDDKADAAEGEVGSGYIVVTQDGKELQGASARLRDAARAAGRQRMAAVQGLQWRRAAGLQGHAPVRHGRQAAGGQPLPVRSENRALCAD